MHVNGVKFAFPLKDAGVKVYQSYDNLHVGNHLLKLERETAYDKTKGKWTAACKSVAGSYVRGGLYLHQQPVHIKCTIRADSRREMGSKEVKETVTPFSDTFENTCWPPFFRAKNRKSTTPHNVTTRKKTVSQDAGGIEDVREVRVAE